MIKKEPQPVVAGWGRIQMENRVRMSSPPIDTNKSPQKLAICHLELTRNLQAWQLKIKSGHHRLQIRPAAVEIGRSYKLDSCRQTPHQIVVTSACSSHPQRSKINIGTSHP
jgi:hypothetical protein